MDPSRSHRLVHVINNYEAPDNIPQIISIFFLSFLLNVSY